MRVGLKPGAGSDDVVVVDQQQPVVRVAAIPMVAKGEGVLRVQPTEVALKSVCGAAHIPAAHDCCPPDTDDDTSVNRGQASPAESPVGGAGPVPEAMVIEAALLRWLAVPWGQDTDRVNTSRSPSPAPAGYRFPREVIAVAVRWYLRYGLSYRDVQELLAERGVTVDHVTVYRWVQTSTAEFIDAARPAGTPPAIGGSSTKPTSRSPAAGPTSTAR